MAICRCDKDVVQLFGYNGWVTFLSLSLSLSLFSSRLNRPNGHAQEMTIDRLMDVLSHPFVGGLPLWNVRVSLLSFLHSGTDQFFPFYFFLLGFFLVGRIIRDLYSMTISKSQVSLFKQVIYLLKCFGLNH